MDEAYSMRLAGFTWAQIAEHLGCSANEVRKKVTAMMELER